MPSARAAARIGSYDRTTPWLCALFFFSGFPALLYQIVWQRSLFTFYGVNIESVTMVVTAFMLGLGIGSLVGGWASKRPGAPLLLIFGGVEFCVAVFGVFSLRVFHTVALFTAGGSAFQTGAITFLLVLAPTTLMGATLPLLTTYLVRFSGNTGRSVGMLYFANTLGSAVACFIAARLTMRYLGESGSVALAAAMNAAIAAAVLFLHFRTRETLPAKNAEAAGADPDAQELLDLRLALVIVAVAGFISLSYEILWYRLYAFVSGGLPKTFAYLLGWYLAGIAAGSLFSRKFCRDAMVRGPHSYLRVAGVFVVLANVLGFLVAPAVAVTVRHANYLFTLPLVALAAASLGAVFPLMSHASVAANRRAGARLSYLYLSNIIGSALGSFGIGFVLMNIWTFPQIAIFLLAAGLALGVLLLVMGKFTRPQLAGVLTASAVMGSLLIYSSGPLFFGFYERLVDKQSYAGMQFADTVESRSGIVNVDDHLMVYGGGVYDGKLITDLYRNDTLVRPYLLSYLHPHVRRVLLIGLAGGSWAEVIARHPQLEHMTLVEIDRGYLEVMRRHAEVAGLLRDPKVEMVVDDGRRWLRRNPERKFDVIVQDTVAHWRAHASALLSVEYLNLVRGHLADGGVFFYNTTFSPEALHTGAAVFPYGLRFSHFLALSAAPLQLDKKRWARILMEYQYRGMPLFNLNIAAQRERLASMLAIPNTLDDLAYTPRGMESRESLLLRTAARRLVTDDNMATEWKDAPKGDFYSPAYAQ